MGTHTILSHPPIRDKILNDIFDKKRAKFNITFSLIALSTITPASYLYFLKTRCDDSPKVHFISQNREVYSKIGIALQSLSLMGIPLLGTNKLPISQATTKMKDIIAITNDKDDGGVRGINRVTRHPVFWMDAMFGIGSIFVDGGKYSSIYFYLPIILQSILGSLKQDLRTKKDYLSADLKSQLNNDDENNDQECEYYKQTSWFPGWAFITGKQSIVKTGQEIGWKRLLASVIVGGSVVYCHFRCNCNNSKSTISSK